MHDHDATAILAAVLRRYEGAGLLRHQPAARAEALEFWTHGTSPEERAAWTRRARSLARARDTFGPTPAVADFLTELAGHTGEPAAAYLFDELTTGPEGFVISAAARTLLDKFRRAVGSSAYDDDVRAVADLPARRQLVEAWLTAYTTASGTEADPGDLAEAVAAELCPDVPRHESDARLTETVGDCWAPIRASRRGLCRSGSTNSSAGRGSSGPRRSPPIARTSVAVPHSWRPSVPGCGSTSTGRG